MGAEEAFAEIVRRHSQMVYSSCLRRLGDAHLAEDASQAVFIALARRASRAARAHSVPGWLYATTRFAASQIIRERSRRARREKEAAKMRQAMSGGGGPGEEDLRRELDRALDALPAKHRDAVVLRHLEGRSHAEVAAELGLREDAARKRSQAGLAKLRGHLARRGIAIGAAALAASIAAEAAQAAPTGLAAAITAAATSAAAGGAASGTAVAIAEGAMKMMMWAKIKMAAGVAVAVTALAGAGVGTGVVVARAQEAGGQPTPVAGAAAWTPPAPERPKPLRVVYVDGRLKADVTDGTYSLAKRSGGGRGGRDGDAYATLKAAVKATNGKPGTTIYLRGGTYKESNIGLTYWTDGSPEKWYTISSYPGEWAVVDGGHAPESDEHIYGYVIWGTTRHRANNYIRIERLEITGAGYDIGHEKYPSGNAGGIYLAGHHVELRYLYVHDNYGKTNNNQAGVKLATPHGSLVEHCRFRDNGDFGGTKTHSVANLILMADYAYAKPVKPEHAMAHNVIRYNLFESSAGDGRYTVTGFKQKGMQRLTGYKHCDRKNPEDKAPNDDSLKAYGDRIHHNIFMNHPVAILIDQDYAQVHHNIVWGATQDYGKEADNCIQGRDGNCSRRGPFGLCVYNNTLITNGCRGIVHHPVPDSWQGGSPYTKCWLQNNIIVGAPEGYDWAPVSVESDGVKDTAGWPVPLQRLDRNLFYMPASGNVAYIDTTKFTAAGLVKAGAADRVYVSKTAGLFQGAEGAGRLKTRGGFAIGGGATVADGGMGGEHPYLEGVKMPKYVGATEPGRDGWVEWVLGLREPKNLTAGGGLGADGVSSDGTRTRRR